MVKNVLAYFGSLLRTALLVVLNLSELEKVFGSKVSLSSLEVYLLVECNAAEPGVVQEWT